VVVREGTLRVGDFVVVGTTYGKIRAMFDDKGDPISSAGPSMPAEIMGIQMSRGRYFGAKGRFFRRS